MKKYRSLIDDTSATGVSLDSSEALPFVGYSFNWPQNINRITLTCGEREKIHLNSVRIYGAREGNEWKLLTEEKDLRFNNSYETHVIEIPDENKQGYTLYKIEFKGKGEIMEIELLGNINKDS